LACRLAARNQPGTTVALATIQVIGTVPSVQPQITKISIISGLVVIDFSAGANDTTNTFTIQAAPNPTGTYSTVNGATITSVGPGQFKATLPTGPAIQYFRISRQGGTPPSQLQFTAVGAATNTILLTFSGDANDPPSAFTVLGAATVNGTYTALPNATVSVAAPVYSKPPSPSPARPNFIRLSVEDINIVASATLIKSLANLAPSEPLTTICRCMKLNRDFSKAWFLGGLIFVLGILARTFAPMSTQRTCGLTAAPPTSPWTRDKH
jgi:hypothetical protein